MRDCLDQMNRLLSDDAVPLRYRIAGNTKRRVTLACCDCVAWAWGLALPSGAGRCRRLWGGRDSRFLLFGFFRFRRALRGFVVGHLIQMDRALFVERVDERNGDRQAEKSDAAEELGAEHHAQERDERMQPDAVADDLRLHDLTHGR